MPNIPIFDNFFYFTAFDKDTHSLLYCKYNFNFDTYSVAFGLVGKPKDEIFFDFFVFKMNRARVFLRANF